MRKKKKEGRAKSDFFSDFRFDFPDLHNQGVVNEWWVMNQLKIAFKMCVYSLKLEHLMELSSSVFVA